MKSVSNIIITSLSAKFEREAHRYFYFEDNGTTHYCDGLSVAEAGTKYLLSRVPIDGIIVLGAGRTFDPGEEMKPLILKEWSDFSAADTGALSEYTFFQYRISQYLDGLDLEAVDILESVPEPRKTEIENKVQEFIMKEAGSDSRPDRLFHLIASNPSLFSHLKKTTEDLTKQEKMYLKRYLYMMLSDSMKLTPRQDNDSLRICFIPTEKNPDKKQYIPAENVTQLINTLNNIEADAVNIYMDMQGLASTEGYTFLAVLGMLSEDTYSKLHIQEIVTSHYDPISFACPIDNNEMKRYDINLLISGMSAFIRYGKVDDVQSYWENTGIKNEHIELLLYAMRRVDEGISLCKITDLETGINMLRQVFSSTPKEELPNVEANIFRILENTIRYDYGNLLEGDTIDEHELVKWALRKKFYQQTLTIIESRLPTTIVNTGLFYYANSEESLQKYMERMNQDYWELQPKDRWALNDMPHNFLKYYGKRDVKRKQGQTDRQRDFAEFRLEALNDDYDGPLLPAFSRIKERKDLLMQLLYSYYQLGDIRNKINHAEITSVDLAKVNIHAENENLKLLIEGCQQFIDAMDDALNYLKTKDEPYTILQLDPEAFKEYASAHKIFKNDRYFDRDSDRRRNDFRRDADKPAAAAETTAPETEKAAAETAEKPAAEAADKPLASADTPAEGNDKPAEGAEKPKDSRDFSSAPQKKTGGYYHGNNRRYENSGKPRYNNNRNEHTFRINAGNSKNGDPQVTITIKIDD